MKMMTYATKELQTAGHRFLQANYPDTKRLYSLGGYKMRGYRSARYSVASYNEGGYIQQATFDLWLWLYAMLGECSGSENYKVGGYRLQCRMPASPG